MKLLGKLTKINHRKNLILLLISFFFFSLGLILGLLFNVENSNDSNEKVYIPDSLLDLFINNISAISSIALGFFSFGIISIVLLVSNGTFIGLIINESISNSVTVSEILIKILPHGVFEIPAILISGVIGFKSLELLICTVLSEKSFYKELVNTVKEVVVLSLVVILLLIFASIIEIYITP